jgi:uncharacterized repeat protein (TIGR03803 family)
MRAVIFKYLTVCGTALSLAAPLGAANASRFTVLHDFKGGTDGNFPYGGLVKDVYGNLYGTTAGGGSQRNGTMFEIAPDGTKTVLYNFPGYSGGGRGPDARLIKDRQGNLYGTTIYGGGSKACGRQVGCGTIYKLAPGGTETPLYSFAGGNDDGAFPQAPLIADKQGNLYGTTSEGDGYGCIGAGCGTVFKFAPDGAETILYSFGTANGANGAYPFAGLIADTQGNVYGTTWFYGAHGCGTVFKLTPAGSLTVLYAFVGQSDGCNPHGGVIADGAGNIYGTTQYGGGRGCYQQTGCGTVFRLAPDGTETVLYSFADGSDGAQPLSNLIADDQGIFYGTTFGGGGADCSSYGCGTVFKLAPDGTETVLHSFTGGSDGAWPYAGLIKDARGNLYGTASAGNGVGCGGYGCGAVFMLRK